jgi:hypothetical protein
VIAVHGLAADPIVTWIEKKEEWNWLENQLVSLLPKARVWTFGYYSEWCGDFSVDTVLDEVAGLLLDSIIAKVLILNRLNILTKPIDCLESSVNTCHLRCAQLWWYRRNEGNLSLKHRICC